MSEAIGPIAATVGIVLLVLALRWATPTEYDPGPWREDHRIPATGKSCRWRSVSSRGLCTRGRGHRGRHDRDPSALDPAWRGLSL